MADDRVFPERSDAYLLKMAAELETRSPANIASYVSGLVRDHDAWRARALNLNPAESLLSRRCRALLDSDMATRLTEGIPGDKVYPHGLQNEHIDQIEG